MNFCGTCADTVGMTIGETGTVIPIGVYPTIAFIEEDRNGIFELIKLINIYNNFVKTICEEWIRQFLGMQE